MEEAIFSALVQFLPFKINDEFSLVPSFRGLLAQVPHVLLQRVGVVEMMGWNAGWKVITSWQFGFLGQNSSSIGTTFRLNLHSSHQLFLFVAHAFLKAQILPYKSSRFCNSLVGKVPEYHLFLLSSMYMLIQVGMCFHNVHKVLWDSCSLIMFSTVVESPQGHLGGTRAGACVSLTGLPHPALCLCAPLCVCACA